MIKRGIIFFVAISFAVGMVSFAAEKGVHKDFEGTLNCIGCDLKKAEGANSQCKIYGHTHGLKLEDGKYISFLENDKSADLIKGEGIHGMNVKVHGVYFSDANLLDVETYEVDGKTYSWCESHGAMDLCHAGMGHEGETEGEEGEQEHKGN